MEDERTLVDEALKGSREAFSGIVRLHQSRVRSYLGRYLRHPEVVDDLAQDTFLDAYRALATYPGEVPLRLWLLRIARHRALRYLRTECRRRERLLRDDVADWLADRLETEPSGGADHDRELSALQACIAQLPERSARLVSDVYFRGRPAIDIARESGRSAGGLWITLLRIRKALRRCVETRLSAAGPA